MGLFPQGRDEHVSDRMTAEITIAVEPVLNDVAPGAAPGVVSAQGSKRHAEITRGKNAELCAQTTA
jgi:hypothetical protein